MRAARAQNFRAQTGPVVEHYQGLGKVFTVATDRAIPDVHAELSALWRSRFAAAGGQQQQH
jgi:hypothetical protein